MKHIIENVLVKFFRRETAPEGTSLWSLTDGRANAEATFRNWGADSVCHIGNIEGYDRYMVRLMSCEKAPSGLWYYAHTDGTSCYVSLNCGWSASDGVTAWKQRGHDGSMERLVNLQREIKALASEVVQKRSELYKNE